MLQDIESGAMLAGAEPQPKAAVAPPPAAPPRELKSDPLPTSSSVATACRHCGKPIEAGRKFCNTACYVTYLKKNKKKR